MATPTAKTIVFECQAFPQRKVTPNLGATENKRIPRGHALIRRKFYGGASSAYNLSVGKITSRISHFQWKEREVFLMQGEVHWRLGVMTF